jgi:ribosome-binding protein aMBF1 (putative translation factor)
MTQRSNGLRKEFADAVREARLRRGLSRPQAAQLAGLSPLIIQMVELGHAPAFDAYLPFLARILPDEET